MAVNLSPVGGVAAQFFTNNGVPLAGGKLYSYAAGTTTPQATYTSSNGGTAHPNPIILDSGGRVPSSGEIWLTDGLQYKFLLKDSNDVLIATYDNVVGINSNFVNYTNEQEIQTATAGQTVFTLTTMQYQPGTSSLSVFVDGVNQYGPGAQYAYVETDATTVTFVSGLHVGASVKFTTSAINASSYGDASQISYTAPFVGSATTNVEDKLAQTISVKDFGAAGDGVTDDRAAIAAAVAAAQGKALYFPSGQYLINSDGGSILLEEVAITGEWVQDGATASIDQGTVFRIIGTTNSPFKIRRGTQINGVGFFYPNQVDSPTPTAYPPTLDFDFTNGPVQFVYIEECVSYNAYRFININDVSGGVGHIWIQNNTICGISRAIEITRNLEVIKIVGNSFTFGHWLAATEAGTRKYMRENAYAVKYDQGDGFWFTNNLIYGYLRGISIAGGNAILTTIANNSFDQVRYPVYATTPGNFQQSNINNNIFLAFNSQDTTQAGIALYLLNTTTADSLNIANNLFGATTGSHIAVDGASTGKLVIDGNTFEGMGYAQLSGDYGAVRLNCANKNVIVSDNYVQANADGRTYGVQCFATNTLQLVGNLFTSCQEAVAVTTCGQVTMTGNVSYTTGGAVSDNIAGVTGQIWQTGNCWDKPSSTSTKPAFLVSKNAAQTFNSGTATDVVWETEIFDDGSDFSSPAFTAPYAGRYRFSWSLTHDNTGTSGNQWEILLTTTSATFPTRYVMVSDSASVSGTVVVKLSATNTAKIQVRRVSGAGNFVTLNSANANTFCVEWVE